MTLEQRQERLQGITSQVKWMTVMLDDILELLNLDENTDLALLQKPFELETLMQDVLLGLERYRLSNIRVNVQIQPDAGLIHGAQKSLETILMHLLVNAIKFSKDEVLINLAVEKNELVMKVVDQGIGILPSEHEIIFKPLVRGSNLDEVAGTGIGLAIVARLVEQIHGMIKLESGADAGTTITVRVPLSSAL
jgi:signal transduction histidine kinase